MLVVFPNFRTFSWGAGRNTAQRLGKYGRRMDPCAKIEAGARIHVSEGMVKDVTVMKYEENG